MTLFEARIPGEPVAQGRPRFFTPPGGFARAVDPAKSRNWKATAHEHFLRARQESGLERPLLGPLRCEIVAVFTCPASQFRRSAPRPRRPHAKKPDAENVAKCVLDALEGVGYLNDSQVAELQVRKIIGAQGEEPYVFVRLAPLLDDAEARSTIDSSTAKQQPEQARLI